MLSQDGTDKLCPDQLFCQIDICLTTSSTLSESAATQASHFSSLSMFKMPSLVAARCLLLSALARLYSPYSRNCSAFVLRLATGVLFSPTRSATFLNALSDTTALHHQPSENA